MLISHCPRAAIQSPLRECDCPIPFALAAHQPVVAIEQDIGRQVARLGFEYDFEVPCDRRIAETKVGCVQQQQSAGLQAAGEITDHPLEGREVKHGITALGFRGAEIAVNQHRKTEDRVIGAGGLVLRRCRNPERHVCMVVRLHPRQAASDVAWVDVDAGDGSRGEILAQAEDFFATGAAKRQYAQVRARSQARGRKAEQPRVAIRSRVIIRLKFTGPGPPDPAAQRVVNVLERMAALARNTFQREPIRKFHYPYNRWSMSGGRSHHPKGNYNLRIESHVEN